jgi:flagellar biosynthesis protein FliR
METITSLLELITVNTIFTISVVFSRLGAMIMTLPGIGETYVAVRSRLLFSLTASIVITPLVSRAIPEIPSSISQLFIILVIEILVGVFIGSICKIFIQSMQIAGTIISTQSALGAALLFDPNQGAQGAIIGNFLTIMAVTLFFSTGLHHVLIQGIVQSYDTFVPGNFLIAGDLLEVAARTLSSSFVIAFKIASPTIVVGFMIMIGAGILSRLMPGMQVFFILTPAQIILVFMILSSTLAVSITWYMNKLNISLQDLLLGR